MIPNGGGDKSLRLRQSRRETHGSFGNTGIFEHFVKIFSFESKKLKYYGSRQQHKKILAIFFLKASFDLKEVEFDSENLLYLMNVLPRSINR